ncbi:MAG: sacsin N-terminal ATP-binding-like domain-containing protein, partial [Promethearchaeota archaeon]
MESNKEFKNSNLERKQIIYPAYQTTRRFHNLYSDVRTFVRELIQNADDADAKSIEFKINLPKQIEVVNDGKTFDSNDIERLLTPCLGGKELDKTGTMNLGALSVLSVSDQPFYHSGNTLLKFEMNHESEDFIPYINENYNLHFNGTRLILPLHSRLSSDDLKKLDNVDEYLTNYSPLLFTRTLKNITLHCSNKTLELKKTIESEELFNYNKKQAIMMNVLVSERFIKGKRV